MWSSATTVLNLLKSMDQLAVQLAGPEAREAVRRDTPLRPATHGPAGGDDEGYPLPWLEPAGEIMVLAWKSW